MHPKRKNDSKAVALLPGMCAGIVLSLLISIFCTVILASTVISEKVTPEASVWYMLVVNMVSVAIGCIAANHLIGNKVIIVCGTIVALYLLVKFGTSILLLDGNVEKPILIVITSTIGGVLAGATTLRNKGKKAFAKKRYC